LRDLLFLAHRIPYPPNKGDKIRSFHILQHLAGRFRVHLGCFFDDAADRDQFGYLRGLCSEVFCLPLGRVRKAARGIHGLLTNRSVSEACYQDVRMRNWVRATIERCGILDIFVFCSTMAPYMLEFAPGRHVVLDMVDVDSEKWRAYADSANWLLRLLYQFEQRHVLELEKRATGASDRVLFVSPAEAQSFAALVPEMSERLAPLENGVDLDRFDPSQFTASPFASGVLPIVFTGAMDYRANVDAVTWFAGDVLPAVRRTHANAEFWIVGGNPSTAVLRLSRHPGIRITGAVADVRPYLAHAACAVAPMRIARGVQNKVLEAMAMAKPVVLTPAALEGLRVLEGREVLVAGSAQDFSDCVSGVLSGLSGELGRAARERVETDYSWPENLRLLDDLFSDRTGPPAPVPQSDLTVHAGAL
jgi:sugar transferase (PEP-CTERM/EpsH1 system associated)